MSDGYKRIKVHVGNLCEKCEKIGLYQRIKKIRAITERTEIYAVLSFFETKRQIFPSNVGSFKKYKKNKRREDEDVADAIQETILNCLEHSRELRKPQYYKTWMIRILINNCKDILKEKCQVYAEEELENRISDSHLKLREVELKDTLERLDEKYRAVIILYYLEGFKVKEIGEILSMNVATVKTRLSRGRKELQKIYGVEKGEREHPFFMKEVTHYAR